MARALNLRSSVLLKSTAAVAVALLASTAVTGVVSSRLTRSALDTQSRELGRGQMSILLEAYSARDRQLGINVRNLGQFLAAQNLLDPDRHLQLIPELARNSSNLELDTLQVLDGKGHVIAGVGLDLANPDSVPRMLDEADRSRLLLALNGTALQVAAQRMTAGDQQLIVLAGYAFDDQFAFSLRRQIGSLEDVILVSSGVVVGSTLPAPLLRPPTPGGQAKLPLTPTKVDRPDFKGMLAYVPLGRTEDAERGAIGLVLHDRVAALQGSLARARLAVTLILALVTLGLAVLLYRYVIRPLVRLSSTARRIAAGDLDASFDTGGEDEIAMLARSLEHMRVELQTKLDLIASQADDLLRQASELQETSQRIVAAEDNERHRLARDLHDGIQQELVVLRMRVGMAAESALLHGGTPRSGSDVIGEFEELGVELDGTIERLREVTGNLYPSILLDRGLAAATRSYIRRLPMTVGITYATDPFPRLDPALESGAYFLLCEALTNTFKHGEASDVGIALCADGGWLTVCVHDDGKGFSPDRVSSRGGLLHMHDRVRSFGGELEIHSAPGEGTKVRARFPIREPAASFEAPATPAAGPAGGDVSRPPARGRTGQPRPAG